MNRIRLLWHSVAPWIATGYGIQTSRMLRCLHSYAAEPDSPLESVATVAYFGLQGGFTTINDTPTYGNPEPAKDPLALDMLAVAQEHQNANLVISLTDVWPLLARPVSGAHWWPWFPLDHEPLPQSVRHILSLSDLPIAMSRFGQRQAELAGIRAAYVPHSVPCDIYQPHPKESRLQTRHNLGLPEGGFVFGMVAKDTSLPSRKSIPQAVEAFSRLQGAAKDIHLYIHTLDPDLFRIRELAQRLGVQNGIHTPNPREYFANFGTDAAMTALYNSFDCLLSPSAGEGFGVPIIEAQACGVPVITHDTTAMPELTGAGRVVPRGQPLMSALMAYQAFPRVDDIYECMRWALDHARSPELRRQARDFVRDKFDTASVFEAYWERLFRDAIE